MRWRIGGRFPRPHADGAHGHTTRANNGTPSTAYTPDLPLRFPGASLGRIILAIYYADASHIIAHSTTNTILGIIYYALIQTPIEIAKNAPI